jgi:hypothetical protein
MLEVWASEQSSGAKLGQWAIQVSWSTPGPLFLLLNSLIILTQTDSY